MLVIPSLDLKSGCVVRFVKGRYSEKVYSDDPLKVARHWYNQGAEFLHIVDLDGALTGEIKNIRILREILENLKIKIEFGGGIRDRKIIRQLLDLGVSRVILSTRAISDEDFLKKVIREFGKKIIVSVDERRNKIAIKGWRKTKDIGVLELAKRLKNLGLKSLIYTDTLRDGTLEGPNIETIKKILENVDISVIASGGIGSLEDIRSLKELEEKGLKGVIIGRALYEKKFLLPEAIRIAK
jgi:phosphoribosylformimino-5-aminoimidazole carboxamide ribotide isomerase